MASVKNPREYKEKSATNLRLDVDVKKQLKANAEEQNKHMADIVNDILRKHYENKEK